MADDSKSPKKPPVKVVSQSSAKDKADSGDTAPGDAKDELQASKIPPSRIPLVPLRDVVVYPHMVIPLFVGREKSILALDEAMSRDKQILLSAQTRADIEDPDVEDVNSFGTLADILQLLKLPDGTIKVLVEGSQRARISDVQKSDDGFFTATAEIVSIDDGHDEVEMEAVSYTHLTLPTIYSV